MDSSSRWLPSCSGPLHSRTLRDSCSGEHGWAAAANSRYVSLTFETLQMLDRWTRYSQVVTHLFSVALISYWQIYLNLNFPDSFDKDSDKSIEWSTSSLIGLRYPE